VTEDGDELIVCPIQHQHEPGRRLRQRRVDRLVEPGDLAQAATARALEERTTVARCARYSATT
jgi:hypothetical protein